jgi:transcription elongation GreA/GreB family factor
VSTYYFTRAGFQRLREVIAAVEGRSDEALALMGEACSQSAETFHDNAGHEYGKAQAEMWGNRLGELRRILALAHVHDPAPTGDEVMFGRTVTFEDLASGETSTLTIGSYMIFDEGDTISYVSPLALLLRGARAGDVKEGAIGDRSRRLRIISVT